MSKRTRTQQRWEELYCLAQQHHEFRWTELQSESKFQSWVATNPDLQSDHAIATALSEYRMMTHPRLSGWLPRIRELATQIMAKEPAATRRRFNHVFLQICRAARDHNASVAAALTELASRLSGRGFAGPIRL